MKKNKSFLREVDKVNSNEEMVILNFLEGEDESQQILKSISPLKNVKIFSLDGVDSELFLLRINGQH